MERVSIVLLILCAVASSGCTNSIQTTAEPIPENTELFPEGLNTVEVDKYELFKTAGNVTYRMEYLSEKPSVEQDAIVYSKGRYRIPESIDAAEVDGSLVWAYNGSVYRDGDKIAEGDHPFAVDNKLGYVNSTPSGDKIVVQDIKLPKFEQKDNLPIEGITYSRGFFYTTDVYGGPLYRNNEVIFPSAEDISYYNNEFPTGKSTYKGSVYMRDLTDVKESNLSSYPFIHGEYYQEMKGGMSMFDLTDQGPIYSINLGEANVLRKGNTTVEKFSYTDMAVRGAQQTRAGIAYHVQNIKTNFIGGYKSTGNKYLFFNGTYYGPYSDLYLKESKTLDYTANPAGQDERFFVTQSTGDWLYT